MSQITAVDTIDIRFPTSRERDGSDAMNPDPDYSAAYVLIRTDASDVSDTSDTSDGLTGHAFVFTIGRGNEVEVAAIDALKDHLVGRNVEQLLANMGQTARYLNDDSQLRWLGPEKGVMHMAIGAVLNALWDLKAKRAGLPLWQLLATMSPEELVELVDFRYLSDAITPEEALHIFRTAEPGRESRIAYLQETGYPGYTTSPGWLGYSDDKLVRLAKEAVADGFKQIKLKVGANLEDDKRRLALARQAVGPDIRIAVDANQRWDVQPAIDWIIGLQDPNIAWVEEPTSPDDVLGHAAIAKGIAPIPVATGEHVQNRIIFKQMLQANALQIMQIDATRVAGVNENIANLLLAAKFQVPVCPHAGGVGLCEAVQHLAMFDFVAVSGTLEGRMIEYVDHLHEHFLSPTVMVNGHYQAPQTAGASTEMRPESIATYRFPDGDFWKSDRANAASHMPDIAAALVQG